MADGSNKILLVTSVCTISPVELIFARKFSREFFCGNFFAGLCGTFLADHGKSTKIANIRSYQILVPHRGDMVCHLESKGTKN